MALRYFGKLEKSNTNQAFWIGIGSISSFSLAIVSTAILSRYLTKDEYGTYRQIIYIYSTLLIIFTAGLPKVFEYFLPRFSINEGKAIVWKITRLLILLGLIFSLSLFLFSGFIANIFNNHELAKGLKVFSIIPFLLLPTLGIEGIFSTYKKAIYIGIYNTLTRFLMLAFIVLPVILWNGSYITAIYGWIVVSVLTLFIAYLFKRIPFKGIKAEKTSLTYKAVFSYSLPLVYASIWGILIRSADQFYVSRYFGPFVFAEFSNGFIQIPIVSMITGSVSLVLMPVFSKMVHNKSDFDELIILWKSSLYKSAILIYPVVVFFIFFANDIILILFSKAYINSIIYFRINMLLNFFNIIIFTPIIFSLGKTRIYARIHMVFALAVWLIEFVILYFFNSPISIAITSVILGIILIITFMIYISKLLQRSLTILIPFSEIFRVLVHALIIVTIVKFGILSFQIDSALMELLVGILFYSSLLIITSGFFKLDYLINIKTVLRTNKKMV